MTRCDKSKGKIDEPSEMPSCLFLGLCNYLHERCSVSEKQLRIGISISAMIFIMALILLGLALSAAI
jgi:hypothetical protein